MRRRRSNEDRPQTETAVVDPTKARERVFQRAAKLLAAKPRSVAELRERLLQGRGATKVIVESVIQRLSEYGYLDDARFAQSYALSRTASLMKTNKDSLRPFAKTSTPFALTSP